MSKPVKISRIKNNYNEYKVAAEWPISKIKAVIRALELYPETEVGASVAHSVLSEFQKNKVEEVVYTTVTVNSVSSPKKK